MTAGNEALLRTIDEAWNHRVVRHPVPLQDIVDFTRERVADLFDERRSALTVAEDANGLTVVSCAHPDVSTDPRTILAAQLSPDRGTLTLEIHNREDPAHFAVTRGYTSDATGCRALVVDLEGTSVRRFFPSVKPRGVREAVTTREPLTTMHRAIGAKVLLDLRAADPTSDVLASNYARRRLMETHCAQDPAVKHPADAFLMPSVQATLRAHIQT